MAPGPLSFSLNKMFSCDECARSFVTWSAISNHLSSSNAHANCETCRRGFPTQHAFAQHLQNAPLHVDNWSSSYDGVPSAQIKPVFRAACNLRFNNVDAHTIITITRTALNPDIVSAILEGALRLLPPDNTPEGKIARREKMAKKSREAATAEATFVSKIKLFQPDLVDEAQQRAAIELAIASGDRTITKSTPDILFNTPTPICGLQCRWLEYKNTFGFKANPYVHQSNKIQYRRYREVFGPGIVVYRLGYERQLLALPGVSLFREDVLLNSLNNVM